MKFSQLLLQSFKMKTIFLVILVLFIINSHAAPSRSSRSASKSKEKSKSKPKDSPKSESKSNDSPKSESDTTKEDLEKTYQPIPDVGKSPDPLPGKTYYIGKAAEDVYWVAKNGYNSMVIVTNSSVVVVDAPTFIGSDLLLAIKDISNLSVSHLIYSHTHIDHIGDAFNLFEKAEKVGHIETARVLEKRKDPNRPVPTTTFSGNTTTLEIGDKTIQLDYQGPIHTPGNIFVWLPNEKILFSCDVINPGWAPFTRLGVAEDTVAYLESPAIMLAYPFEHFIAGHWGKLGTRQDILTHMEYLQDVQNNSMIARSMVNFTAIAMGVKDPTNIGVIAYLAFKEQTDKCTELTLAKWLTRLAGADVYTNSNCDAIGMAQDIDYGNKVIS